MQLVSWAVALSGLLLSHLGSAFAVSLDAREEAPGSVILLSTHESLHRILLIRADGGETYQFGTRGKRPGNVLLPLGAAFDSKARVWVADTLNDRIQVFDRRGKLLRIVPSAGGAKFNRPMAIVVDRKNHEVYALDSGNARVVVLDEQARFRRAISSEGHLASARGLAVDSERDLLYVSEIGPVRVSKFKAKSGELLGHLGSRGMAAGNLLTPLHVAVDSKGAVYVSDDQTNRITKFDSEGALVTTWGGFGSDAGQLYHPRGLVFDSSDKLYVLDYGNRRGQIYNVDGKLLGSFGESIVNSSRKFPPVPH